MSHRYFYELVEAFLPISDKISWDEFFKCYRKKAFTQDDLTNEIFKNEKTQYNYPCEYCDFFHKSTLSNFRQDSKKHKNSRKTNH